MRARLLGSACAGPCAIAVAGAGTAAATGSPSPVRGADDPGVTVRVASTAAPPRACGRFVWRLAVASTGREPVRLLFRSGQRGDLVLRRRGRVAYRCAAKRGFTVALSTRFVR